MSTAMPTRLLPQPHAHQNPPDLPQREPIPFPNTDNLPPPPVMHPSPSDPLGSRTRGSLHSYTSHLSGLQPDASQAVQR